MTTNPLSKNRRYAERYGFRGLVVPPGLVMNVVFSQSVEDISENARANLEYIDMRFGAPVYIGDTIEVDIDGPRRQAIDPRPGARRRARADDGPQSGRRGRADLRAQGPGVEGRPEGRRQGSSRGDRSTRSPASRSCRRTTQADATASWRTSRSPDTYFEDFTAGDIIEHSRGRVMTTEHVALTAMLDNTSQVHCNQFMIDQNPETYVGGQLIVYGGIPFNLCLGLSCPDIADNASTDIVYHSGRHTAPRLCRRHGLRLDGDPRQARLAGPAGPRDPRDHPARAQVRAQGRQRRNGSRSSISNARSP